MTGGSLDIVGIGYQLARQITPESLDSIRRADRFFFIADAVTEIWLRQLRPDGESLADAYVVGKERLESYQEMVERMLVPVRKGLRVCAAFYGHPGVCVYAGHEAVRRARRDGYRATMLPAISSADCLFADLGIDPADGCQMFEATSFLVRKRKLDTSVGVLLWQVCSIAVSTYHDTHETWNIHGVRVLAGVLQKMYSPRHKVILYEASAYPVCDTSIRHVHLRELPQARITSASLLYVPPKGPVPYNRTMLAKLHLR